MKSFKIIHIFILAGIIFLNTYQSIAQVAPSTTIVSPAQGSWHNSDFTVVFSDYAYQTEVDIGLYLVRSLGTTTRDWTARAPNGECTITVGPDGLARNQGYITCLVQSYCWDLNMMKSSAVYRDFNIDWTDDEIAGIVAKNSINGDEIIQGMWTNDRDPYFEFSVNTETMYAPIAGYSWAINFTPDDISDLSGGNSGAIQLPMDMLSEGLNSFKVRAIDAAGNFGTVSSFEFGVDYTGDMITSVMAYTDDAGSLIPESTWQNDQDVWFEWTLPESTSPIVGYSWMLNGIPDNSVDITIPGLSLLLPNGISTFSVRSIDAAGNVGPVKDFVIFVGENSVPKIVGQYELSMNEDTEYKLSMDDIFIDYANPIQDLHLNIYPGENYLNSGDNIIPYQDFCGTLYVNISVNSLESESELYSLLINVIAVNDPPIFNLPTFLPIAYEDNPYSYNLDAYDIDGDQLTYSANYLPPCFNLNPNTGEFTNFPNTNCYDDGIQFSITFIVSDDEISVEKTTLFQITGINDPPYVDCDIPDIELNVGETYYLNLNDSRFFLDVEECNAADPTCALYFSAEQCNGELLPEWLNLQGFTLSGVPTYLDFVRQPEIQIRMMATDSDGASVYNDFNITIVYDGPELVYIPDPNFEAALIEQGIDSKADPDHYILITDAEAVTNLDISSREIEDLTGIEAFINLVYLNCSNNLLSELDISNIQGLQLLVCNNNQLSTLNVSQNLSLQRISCNNNLLTSLDVSQHNSLLTLECAGNNIPDLDVSYNLALVALDCSNNPMGTLDVSQNQVLERLYCGSNQLSTLDISQNSALIYLYCSYNSLSQLDLSGNKSLEMIHCAGNDLESLNVSIQPELFGLFCYENQLENLDLTNNPKITELWCRDNLLNELNVKNGNNHNVTTFEADENFLSCITVDDELAGHNGWITDPGVIFSNDCGYNTQRGESVAVLPVDETTEKTPVEVTFDAVNLSGITSLETGEAGPDLPGGFTFGEPPSYFDISTTAEFTGPVQIVIDYSEMEFAKEEDIRLMHYEAQKWIDVTTLLDTENDMIYGEVMMLSPFGILQDIEPPVFSETSDIIINNPGPTGAYVGFDIPTATDNSPGVIVEQTDETGLTSGSFFPLGVTTLSYMAMDVAGNTATCSFNVILNNLGPVIDEIIAPVDPISLGTEANVTVFFTDDNLVEATINWGDGTDIVYGDIVDQAIEWNYTYPAPGVYAVSIQLIDIGGKTADDIIRYIVVFDPAGGFITGGGWINSPVGAYMPDPLLGGKANFGFVAKYKKGKTVPEGNTEFQFRAGDLKFKSTLYDWLVIAGAKAKFKGEGTINNFGNYGFMLSAIDGDLKDNVDRFRIKIWDKEANDLVVYDNEFASDETTDPSTMLGGGSIVIHNPKDKDASGIHHELTEGHGSVLFVYPNPAEDYLNIAVLGNREDRIELRVYNAIGEMIHYSEGKSALYEELSVSAYKPGMYMITTLIGDILLKENVLIK